MRYFTLCAMVMLIFFGCIEKENITQTEHTNEIISGNTPPPYSEATTVQVQNYINRAFIDLLGREPIQDTLQKYTDFLRTGDFSQDRLDLFLETLTTQQGYLQEYYEQFDETLFAKYLPATPKSEVLQLRQVYQDVYDQYIQTGDLMLAQLIQVEIAKLDNLLRAFIDYSQQAITINQYIFRICDNDIYDEINMGSENFVLSCFENFLKRLPTNAELEAGVTMVDGFSARLLLSDGNTRSDFLRIITETPGFYEGLAIDTYAQLLSRLPNSEEMTEITLEMSAGMSFQELQRKVMTGAEYTGF